MIALWKFGRSAEEKAMRQRYRNVFTTTDGEIVLMDIMTRLHHFDELRTSDMEEVVLFNFSQQLWGIIGPLDVPEAPLKNIQALLRIPVRASGDKE